MTESKEEAYVRLRAANMWDKFQKRTALLLKTFRDVPEEEMFQRVLREYPPAGTEPIPAFSDEEFRRAKLDYANLLDRDKYHTKEKIERQEAATVQSTGFTKNELAKIHKLPQGSAYDGIKFAMLNLFNPEVKATDFPCTMAFTYWMLGQNDPKLIQQQALKLLDKSEDEINAELNEDRNKQYRILERLGAFHSVQLPGPASGPVGSE